MPGDLSTLRLTISGKVQGVWYRASAKDKALSLGIKGRVWNEKNGDVGAVVQGTQEQLKEFVAWCHDGPPLAKVEEVRVEEVRDKEVFGDFAITRNPVRDTPE